MSISSYLRTNYRLTGAKVDPAEILSQVIIDSVSAVTIGSGSAYVMASMGGYGSPSQVVFFGISWVGAGGSNAIGPIVYFSPASISGSIAFASVFTKGGAGSVTVTRALSTLCRIGFLAIIGSR